MYLSSVCFYVFYTFVHLHYTAEWGMFSSRLNISGLLYFALCPESCGLQWPRSCYSALHWNMLMCVSHATVTIKKKPQASVAENNKYVHLTFTTCPLWAVRGALLITKWPIVMVQSWFLDVVGFCATGNVAYLTSCHKPLAKICYIAPPIKMAPSNAILPYSG